MFKTYEDASRFGRDMMENGVASIAALQSGLQAIADEAGDYSRKSMDNGAAVVEKLLAARSPERAIEIQSEYVRQSYEGFVAQSTRMSELMAELAKVAYKPFEQAVAKAK